MRVLKTLLKCIIILVVRFLLSAAESLAAESLVAESLADWFASVIDGGVFISCIIDAIIAVVMLSIIKPDKFN